ncbi:ligand-binding sensor domain-containing protein [Cognaticolwellia beringensis]|uniref:Diguanylate cyclase n=1 Tax=Cognaticolwellia beringensis TaxID=1967665 RepID=A0A222GC47_9GAMM|nr:two-component regulator propeller domain-containing protein [Cognaticolwellia beringensis]ASP48934.1 diguanylate cyclase [Cognaticolwellia beringensis]
MSKKFYLCFALLFSNISFAQESKLFKSFAIDNPMSYKFVMTIAQDKNGFMWFGGQEGLHRYDGHQLLSFYNKPLVDNSLSSNVISRIIIDSKQQLWIGTRGGGINLYQPESNSFRHLTTKTKHAQISNDGINTLFEDSEGKIWIGTENGLNILTITGDSWNVVQVQQKLAEKQSLSHNIVHSIIETDEHDIWVGTNGGGISVFDTNGNFKHTIKYAPKKADSYVNKYVNALFKDKQGNIWVGTVDKGLLKYSANNNIVAHFKFDVNNDKSISSDTIHNVYQDAGDNIWIATDNGLSIYDNKTDQFERFNYSVSNPYSVSSNYIMNFFEDQNGLMWIGTNNGLNRWDPTMTTFRQYTAREYPTLDRPNITSFSQASSQSIYFSAYNGRIYQLLANKDEVIELDLDGFFENLRVMTLFYDNNTLWVGTRASGLYHVNLTTKLIETYAHDELDFSSISANSVTDIIKDNKGQLWVSTFNQGLNRMNDDGSFTRYVSDKNNPELGPNHNAILHILEDEQGIIWIATYGGGLSRFDHRTENFQHIINDEADPNSLSSDLSWYLLLDNDKNLWVSTQAAGLNVLSYKDRVENNYRFKRIDTNDGMKSQTVYGMTQDKFNDIWLSSNQGITRFSVKSNIFKHFDLSHGLVDLDYNHGAIFNSLDNVIYFGAGKGVTSIRPDNNQNKISPIPVRLTNVFKLNEAMYFSSALTDLKSLELDYNDQLISFEYVGLNYAYPESTKYKYRLLGFDQEWLDAGKSRRATYTNLPAGKFQLQIIAGNSDNVWSDPGLSLDIIVKPAPWNTWWAYILYTSAVALALLYYSRFLNRKLVIEQQQKLYLEQQVHEKTEKFTSKNLELAQANKQLEKAAIVDKVTGVKSRRYLDIYIEQTSQLMHQMHQNLLPVQRDMLPRLYILMVQLKSDEDVSNSQLINLTDLLHYSRNNDDLVIRWSHDTFAVIGYEKGNNANELAARLSGRLTRVVDKATSINMAYSFFPFSRENPLDLTWDQISVLIEQALTYTDENKQLSWLGLCGPKSNTFDYLQLMQQGSLTNLKEQVITKSGLA